jgi:hypothetical protein
LLEHIVIPKAYHDISLAAQPFIPLTILRALGMLAAVNFDDHFMIEADEIDNVWANRNLAFKF